MIPKFKKNEGNVKKNRQKYRENSLPVDCNEENVNEYFSDTRKMSPHGS